MREWISTHRHMLLLGLAVWFLVIPLGFILRGIPTAVAAAEVGPPVGPEDPLEIAAKVRQAGERWLASLGDDGWLYLARKFDNPYAQGVDPDVGWPLFRLYLEELWFQLDTGGNVVTVLIRTTDLERGNAYRLAWEPGRILREPDWADEFPAWPDFPPPIDGLCTLGIEEAARLAVARQGETFGLVTAQWAPDGDLLSATAEIRHPPVTVPDFTGKPDTYVGTKTVCRWDPATGALTESEYWLLASNGTEFLMTRGFDYQAARVLSPPGDMMDLLDQLRAEQK